MEIFTNLPPVSTIPAVNLPPVPLVSLIPGPNLPPVSTKLAVNLLLVSMTAVANNGNNIRLLTP